MATVNNSFASSNFVVNDIIGGAAAGAAPVAILESLSDNFITNPQFVDPIGPVTYLPGAGEQSITTGWTYIATGGDGDDTVSRESLNPTLGVDGNPPYSLKILGSNTIARTDRRLIQTFSNTGQWANTELNFSMMCRVNSGDVTINVITLREGGFEENVGSFVFNSSFESREFTILLNPSNSSTLDGTVKVIYQLPTSDNLDIEITNVQILQGSVFLGFIQDPPERQIDYMFHVDRDKALLVRKKINQAAHGLSVGQWVKLNGADTYALAQANTMSNAEVVGVVSSIENADNFTIALRGWLDIFSGLTANTIYYLSPTVPGALTPTEPTLPGLQSKPLLNTSDTNAGYIQNYRTIDGISADQLEFLSRDINQVTHGLVSGDVVRLSAANTYVKAQADSVANAEAIGMVVNVPDADNFDLLFSGYISAMPALTADTRYYLSASTAGAVTSTPPSAPGEVIKVLLHTDTTDSGYWLDYPGDEIKAGGMIASLGDGTETPRTITGTASEIDVADGDGVAANPTISLNTTVTTKISNLETEVSDLQAVTYITQTTAGVTSAEQPLDAQPDGFLTSLTATGVVTNRTLTGTTDQIDITNGTGAAGDPQIAISDNPIIPGAEGMSVPDGNTAQRPGTAFSGILRYNLDLVRLEYGDGTVFRQIQRQLHQSVSVYNSISQAISTSTDTPLEFDTAVFDDDSVFNLGTHTFQPTIAGRYNVTVAASIDVPKKRYNQAIHIRKNGTNVGSEIIKYEESDPLLFSTVSVSKTIEMNGTTDSIQIFVFQDSTLTLNTDPGENWVYFTAFLTEDL